MAKKRKELAVLSKSKAVAQAHSSARRRSKEELKSAAMTMGAGALVGAGAGAYLQKYVAEKYPAGWQSTLTTNVPTVAVAGAVIGVAAILAGESGGLLQELGGSVGLGMAGGSAGYYFATKP